MLFGESAISVETLATELRTQIPSIAALQTRNPDGNKAFTVGVKQALKEIGQKAKLRTFFTEAEPGMKEFMLDVVWWAETPQGQWAVMGAESEWGTPGWTDVELRSNQVVEDFEKLLCFKAPLKLLFFSTENQAMRDRTHTKIQKYLRNYAHHVSGEQYLFMEFSQGQCYSYKWTAVGDGRCAKANLIPLDDASAKVLERRMGAGA